AYTLPEALWLAGGGIDDVVVGYPTAARAAIAQLAADPVLAARVTLMVDSVAHLDFIDAVVPPTSRNTIRVCLELDASWNSRLFGHIGTWRSPIHTVADARALAERITSRPGFELVGMMAYEGQVAGLADRPAGKPMMGAAVRWIQRQSVRELAERRGRGAGPRRARRAARPAPRAAARARGAPRPPRAPRRAR